MSRRGGKRRQTGRGNTPVKFSLLTRHHYRQLELIPTENLWEARLTLFSRVTLFKGQRQVVYLSASSCDHKLHFKAFVFLKCQHPSKQALSTQSRQVGTLVWRGGPTTNSPSYPPLTLTYWCLKILMQPSYRFFFFSSSSSLPYSLFFDWILLSIV